MTLSRRSFLFSVAAAGAGGARLHAFGPQQPAPGPQPPVPRVASPFKVSVLSDEITTDFGRAAEIAAKDFGLGWVEVREAWKKNVTRLDATEIEEMKRILSRFDLKVTAIASPLFKVDWPGAPRSKFSPVGDQFKADWTFDQQGEVLDRSIALCKALGTDHIRCFDFWRLADAAPYRAAMNDKLREAAARVAKEKITLVIENEPACNTATAAESVAVLNAVKADAFKLNWDPGNAAAVGDKAFPDGYALLPKERIGHVHVKDAIHKADGGHAWAAMGQGSIDWTGQFRALLRDGYRGPLTLETHWRGAGTAEASTRQCWAAMSRQLHDAGAL